MKALGIVLAIVAVLLVGTTCGGISIYNGLVDDETGIEAIDKDMQNVHASVYKQIKGQGLAVEKYGEMVIESFKVAMSGRYGGGSQAAWQWIKEQNPDIKPEIMSKLQVIIEAGYTKFEATQRTKIDRVRSYKAKLRKFPSNVVAWVCRFPKIDLKLMDRIVTSAETKHDFDTGELSDPDPFGKKDKPATTAPTDNPNTGGGTAPAAPPDDKTGN